MTSNQTVISTILHLIDYSHAFSIGNLGIFLLLILFNPGTALVDQFSLVRHIGIGFLQNLTLLQVTTATNTPGV